MPVETDCQICGKTIYLVAIVESTPVWAHYYNAGEQHEATPPDAIAEAFKDSEHD